MVASTVNSDLTKVTPPKELTNEDCAVILKRLSRKLASFRNTAELYASTEADATHHSNSSSETKVELVDAIDAWAQETLKNIWLACREPGGGMQALCDGTDTYLS